MFSTLCGRGLVDCPAESRRKVDHRAVIPVIPHRELDEMAVLFPLDDDLIAGTVTHDQRGAGALLAVELIAEHCRIFPQVDPAFGRLEFLSGMVFLFLCTPLF